MDNSYCYQKNTMYSKTAIGNIQVWHGCIRIYHRDSVKSSGKSKLGKPSLEKNKPIKIKEEWNSPQIKLPESYYSVIYPTWGILGGKMQFTQNIITKGKNIGRRNETNVLTQAMIELNSLINKKKDQGYLEDLEKLKIGKQKILPMLAVKFQDRKNAIHYPAIVQKKLDGVRVIANIISNNQQEEVKFSTRKGKDYKFMDHIRKEILGSKSLRKILHSPLQYLDAEMYTSQLPFQMIVGLAKKQLAHKINSNTKEKMKLIELHVFDYFDLEQMNMPFSERFKLVSQAIKTDNKLQYIKLVLAERVNNEKEVIQKHDEYIKYGYEGIMIRNMDSLYKFGPTRSKDLQKYKDFMDEEFLVINIIEGKGKDMGTAIFVCLSPDKEAFKVRSMGTLAYRKYIYEHQDEYIGKYITVRFQEYTTKQVNGKTVQTKIPRFGRSNGIPRDYE